MQRKYYTYDAAAFSEPNPGVPMHGGKRADKKSAKVHGDEAVKEISLPVAGAKRNPAGALFKDGRILGRFEADDIILLCIIFLLLQNSDEADAALLLALGYIFLSDKDLNIL